MHATREILRLAYRDFAHERRISLCYVLALMAVLAPILVLFGLKFGLVDTLARRLVESPANREVIAVGSRRYDDTWFAAVASRPDVAFVVPNTRRIAASLSRLLSPETGGDLRAIQMIPTAPGDPLLRPDAAVPQGLAELVLSASAARKLGVAAGGRVLARIDRRREGKDEGVVWELKVAGVLSAGGPLRGRGPGPPGPAGCHRGLSGRGPGACLGLGRLPPPTGARAFARFRLYAASIYDVARLESDLSAEGIEVRSQLAEIASMQALDRNLGRVFWLIAGIGTLGFLASLAANLLANVERKRRELSIVRLIGFTTGSLVLFPVAQAALVAVLGALAAVLSLFAGGLGPERLVHRESATWGVDFAAPAYPRRGCAYGHPARLGHRRCLGRVAGRAYRASGGDSRCLTLRSRAFVCGLLFRSSLPRYCPWRPSRPSRREPAPAISWPVKLYNPAPAAKDLPADLILPLPCGGAMAFRPVEIPGAGWLDDRPVEMGQSDADRGYKEGRRLSHLAGAFTDQGGAARRYYIGKYEVTRDQYAALMGPDCPEPTMRGRLPMTGTSWFDAVDLSRRFTEWLLAKAPSALPREDRESGILRLPTEEEWEFAARGGLAVDATDFLPPVSPCRTASWRGTRGTKARAPPRVRCIR